MTLQGFFHHSKTQKLLLELERIDEEVAMKGILTTSIPGQIVTNELLQLKYKGI